MNFKSLFFTVGILSIFLLSFGVNITYNSTNDLSSSFFNSSLNSNLYSTTVSSNQSNCWTFLVYMSADNNLEKFAVQDVQEMVQGSINVPSCVHFVLQIDRSTYSNSSLGYSNQPLPGQSTKFSTTQRYLISNGSLIHIANLGQLDMGNQSTFQNFLSWGMSSFPANHTVLIIWGYGSPSTVSFDQSFHSSLTPFDLRLSIQTVESQTHERLDVIGFDASSIASASFLFQLKDVTNAIIAPESLEPSQSWNYVQAFGVFKGSTLNYLTPDSWARSIVSSYQNYFDSIHVSSANLGFFSSFYLNYVFQTLHDFSHALLDQFHNSTNDFNLALAQSLAVARNDSKDISFYSIDLFDLVSHFQQLTNDSSLQHLAHAVQTAIQYALNDWYAGSSLAYLHGISIFFPQQFSSNVSFSLNSYSIFSPTSCWYQVLQSFYTISNSSIYHSFLSSHPIHSSLVQSFQLQVFPTHLQFLPSSFSFLNPILSNSQSFSYVLNSSSSQPVSGSLLVYDEQPGGRLSFTPQSIIPVSNFTSGTTGSFNFTFLLTGFSYLRVEFIPVTSLFTYGSSPYVSFTQNFFVPSPNPFIIPFFSQTTNLTFLASQPIQFNLSLANYGILNYPGGSLDVYLSNPSSSSFASKKTLSIPSISSKSLINISISLPALTTAGQFSLSLILDNSSLNANHFLTIFSIPDHITIVNPLDLLSATLLFNGLPSYQITSFFTFNAANLQPSFNFTLPSNPSSLGTSNFTFSVLDQNSVLTSQSFILSSSNWSFSNGLFTTSSPSLTSFTNLSVFLTPGTLYTFQLTSNSTGSTNLLPNSYYFQPFLPSHSHVVIDNFSLAINYVSNLWTINTTLTNLGNTTALNSYDDSLLQVYSLTASNYFSVYRKNITTGLPDIPANSTMHDSFSFSLNLATFPTGDVVVHYNYFNSLGSYDLQRQSVFKDIINTHDYQAPLVSLTVPNVVATDVPFTLKASITDRNPFSYSVSSHSQILVSGLITIDGTLSSQQSQNVQTYDYSGSFVFTKNGTYQLTFLASDLGLNHTSISRTIIVKDVVSKSTTTPISTTVPSSNTSTTSSTHSGTISVSTSTSSKNKSTPFAPIYLLLASLLVLSVIKRVRK